jgi:hypothetical protein
MLEYYLDHYLDLQDRAYKSYMERNTKMHITNAFSINMLPKQKCQVTFTPITVEKARDYEGEYVSAIGHADTARIVGSLLFRPLEAARVNVNIEDDEYHQLMVAQYIGPRLPEGATELPEGAEIQFWHVELKDLIEVV